MRSRLLLVERGLWRMCMGLHTGRCYRQTEREVSLKIFCEIKRRKRVGLQTELTKNRFRQLSKTQTLSDSGRFRSFQALVHHQIQAILVVLEGQQLKVQIERTVQEAKKKRGKKSGQWTIGRGTFESFEVSIRKSKMHLKKGLQSLPSSSQIEVRMCWPDSLGPVDCLASREVRCG